MVEQKADYKKIELAYKKATGFRINGETGMTLSSFSKKRTCNINGKDIICEYHISLGGLTRIYYHIQDNIMYVAHCGSRPPSKKYPNLK